MNADPEKGVYGSIGVTAASPKLTRDLTEQLITTGKYYQYFDYLPFFTVDGVNDQGVYAQSNVVSKNGVEININANDPTKEECCIVMLVRYVLDHFNREDIKTAESIKRKLKDNLHIYGTSKLGGYNPHYMIAHWDEDPDYNKSYVVELTADDVIVNEFPIMTNFRTIDDELHPIPVTPHGKVQHWDQVEQNGIGLERWDIAADFLDEYGGATSDDFKILRSQLNYTHAYDRPDTAPSAMPLSVWLTDNLSADLTVNEAKTYHDGELTGDRKTVFDNVLSGYRNQFDNRSRDTGITWHTTHSAIYDLTNLSCNIQTQQDTQWNILFDGTITKEQPEPQTTGGAWDAIIMGSTQFTIPWNESLGYWLLQEQAGSAWIKYDGGVWKLYETAGSQILEVPSSETSRSAKRFVCTYNDIPITCIWHE